MTGIGEVWVRIQERDASGAFLRQNQSTFDPDDASRLAGARRTYTHTVSDPNTAAIVLVFGLSGLTVDNAIDVTFRIGAPQLEQAPVPSSLILPPAGAPAPATRATETVTAPWPHAPQPMTLYVRIVETGGVLRESDSTIVRIGASPGNRVVLFNNAATGTYALRYVSNGSVATLTLSVAPVRDDIVELLIPIDGAGAYLAQSINGSDPTQTTLAGLPIPTAWEPPTLTIGGGGQFDLLDLIVLRGAGWTMDQIREVVGV